MSFSPSTAASEAATSVIVLADDLTGACDSGAAFLATGRPVHVMLGASFAEVNAVRYMARHQGPAVWAFTTESRNRSEEDACESVAEFIAAFPPILPESIFFKKVDSAARGHLGAETITALQCSGAELALVAPAFPQAGRIVQSGILHVLESCGRNESVSLHKRFPQMDPTRIGSLPIGTESELEQGIAAAIANGTRILLGDAVTQADLDLLASVAYRSCHPILWAGSAGLARALASVLPAFPAITTLRASHRDGRTLLFVGSSHSVTRRQLAHLDPHPNPLDRTVHPVCFDATSRQEVQVAFFAAPVAALILTGGDTAAFVLRALDASSLVLAGEIAPGIPWGWIEGGAADGCMVVTKSGGFGGPGALAKAFEFCARRSCEPA